MKRIFIITGANRGLGHALADVLIQREDHFIISLSRSQSEVQSGYKKDGFYWLKVDLAENSLEEKLEELKHFITTQEVCFINNASIIEPISSIANLQENDIDKVIAVNIKAPMLIVKHLLKYYVNNKLTFVNISTGAAHRPIHNWSLYCATKASAKMFFDVAQHEYEQHRFFSIDPGVMDTSMQERIRENDFPDAENFRIIHREGKLKLPSDVAVDIVNTLL